jgi:two-component sensor histidine kinase
LKSVQPPPVSGLDLVMEANHRITNNLNALTLLLRGQIREMRAGPELVKRDEAMARLTETAANLVAMSRLHNRLTVQPAEGNVDLHAVLSDILQELKASGLFGDRLRIRPTLNSGFMVEASHASMVALAFSEIVTNAMKYAHPIGVPVELAVTSVPLPDGSRVLNVSDDGVGFPDGFNENRDAGVGLKLVRALVESVGGLVGIKSDVSGLVFSIHLPPIGGKHQDGERGSNRRK